MISIIRTYSFQKQLPLKGKEVAVVSQAIATEVVQRCQEIGRALEYFQGFYPVMVVVGGDEIPPQLSALIQSRRALPLSCDPFPLDFLLAAEGGNNKDIVGMAMPHYAVLVSPSHQATIRSEWDNTKWMRMPPFPARIELVASEKEPARRLHLIIFWIERSRVGEQIGLIDEMVDQMGGFEWFIDGRVAAPRELGDRIEEICPK